MRAQQSDLARHHGGMAALGVALVWLRPTPALRWIFRSYGPSEAPDD
jgi:hypothetical protein